MFRISAGADCPIIDVETAAQIGRVIRPMKPGRYHIDEITEDPLPSGSTSRHWGVVIKRADGSVVFEHDAWPYGEP
jgi:hypothetical protein